MLYVIVLCCNICFMLDLLENEMVHLKGLSINTCVDNINAFYQQEWFICL